MHIHLNILLLMGLALFGGTIGGRVFQRLKIPQVVGYIIIGLLIGKSGLKIVDSAVLASLQPFSYFALGLIGFMVGGELKKEMFRKYGRQLIYILLSEGIAPFILVTVLIGLVGGYFFGTGASIWALAILLGAIASATDPATTTSVLNEYKTRGPLTSTILGIVALDDGLALSLFAIASSVAGALIGQMHGGVWGAVGHLLYEILGSVALGVLSGWVLIRVLRSYTEIEKTFIFSIGSVLFVTGLSLALKLDLILALMAMGVLIVNLTPRKSKEIFQLVEGFAPPIFVLFFVLVGAKLDLSKLTLPIMALVGIYLFGTFFGKMIGAKFGARISKAPKTVQQYLPICLFPQAGVAIGLSILASQYFSNDIGNTIVIIITATTFLSQLIGPAMTKLGVTRAGEVGLNITEDDLIKQSKALDIMDNKPPVIYEDASLANIMQVFSQYNNLNYPVINKNNELRGIITIDGLRHTVMESSLSDLLLAHDLMEPVIKTTNTESPMSEVKELMNRYALEYLPVLDKDKKLAGFIEERMLNKFISTKLIELQKQADSLG